MTDWRQSARLLREASAYLVTTERSYMHADCAEAAALIEAQAAEVERLTKALDAIAGGGKNCISLLSDPPQCARWYLARATLAAGKAEASPA